MKVPKMGKSFGNAIKGGNVSYNSPYTRTHSTHIAQCNTVVPSPIVHRLNQKPFHNPLPMFQEAIPHVRMVGYIYSDTTLMERKSDYISLFLPSTSSYMANLFFYIFLSINDNESLCILNFASIYRIDT